MNIKTFIDNVEDMRKMQREYFRTRNTVLLQDCKSVEQTVDREIAQYREQQSGQTNLFDVEKPGAEKGCRDD